VGGFVQVLSTHASLKPIAIPLHGSERILQVLTIYPVRFASKVEFHDWIGSVQGAVATWSNNRSQESLENIAC